MASQEPGHLHARELENLKGSITLGIETMKALVLVNGGAAAGVLTFYGNAISSHPAVGGVINASDLTSGLACFAGGLLVALFASGLSWIGQYLVVYRTGDRRQAAFFGAAALLCIASAACFAGGVLWCGAALSVHHHGA